MRNGLTPSFPRYEYDLRNYIPNGEFSFTCQTEDNRQCVQLCSIPSVRVSLLPTSMSLKPEPSSEPLHIYVKCSSNQPPFLPAFSQHNQP